MRKSLPKLLVLFLILILFFLSIKCGKDAAIAEKVFEFVNRLGSWGPAFYVVLYILISGILIPSIAIKIFAGTLFGIGWGIILVSIAATLSSSIKFLLARYLFREAVQKKVEKSEKLKAIDRAIEREGWKMLIILRNVPVVNSMLLNYICAITKIKFKDFAIASFIGRLPTSIMYIYLGHIARYAYKTGWKAYSIKQLTVEKTIVFTGLLAALGATLYLIHISKNILNKKAPSITG